MWASRVCVFSERGNPDAWKRRWECERTRSDGQRRVQWNAIEKIGGLSPHRKMNNHYVTYGGCTS